jgi:hypothetical protein
MAVDPIIINIVVGAETPGNIVTYVPGPQGPTGPQGPAGGVTSVNGHTGVVTLSASDVSAVPNSSKGIANGVASLDGTGKVPSAQLPATASAVTSVNTQTGAVVLAATDVGAIPTTQKGAANGVASLDGTGKVPSGQLPSYVDDVLEFTNQAAFPATGTTGLIYVALDTNKIYRWSGSAYVEISSNSVNSVNGKTGVVALVPSDIGAFPADGTTTLPIAQIPTGVTITTVARGNDSRIVGAEQAANKGVANGYASLDGTGKVPASQLPSYVDDVLEYANQAAFPATGSAGLIYVALDTNKIYRWSGSAYIEISPSTGGTGAVSSVNGYTGTVVLAASDVSAIPTSAKAVANGVASLDSNGQVPVGQIKTGVIPGTIAAGNDSRFAAAEQAANKGVANGYAGLDGTGKVPAAQLPSYVDDVLEYANLAALPATGSTGLIYVTLDTNKIYRWSGSAYIEISPSTGGGSTTQTIAKKTGPYTIAASDVDSLVIINAPGTAVTPTLINNSFTGTDGTAVTSLVPSPAQPGGSIVISGNAALVTTGNQGSYSGGINAMLSTDGTTFINSVDIDVTYSFKIVGDVFPGINVRGPQTSPNGQGGYSVNLNNGTSKIGKTVGYSGTTLVDTGVNVSSGVYWTVRFAVYGSNIYLWLVSGKAAVDPNAALSTAQWTTTDTALTASGYHNLVIGGGGLGQQTFLVDDLYVKGGPSVAPASVWTLPNDTTATIAVGSTVYGARYTAEDVTVAGASGVTVLTADTLTARKRYSTWSATKTAANEWLVVGDFT